MAKEKDEKTFEENITNLEAIVKDLESGNVPLDDAINKFNEAMETFQKELQLSEQLRDKDKINESKCNIGIVYFHLGKLDDAVNYIQKCYEYISVICQANSGQNTIQNLNLLCKSGSNLSRLVCSGVKI